MLKRLAVLLSRPDFRENPAKALWGRIVWRLKCRFSSNPLILKLSENIKIAVPKGSAGALIFYQGVSEPQTAEFIQRFLKPGMVFWDVGAYIGEFALLAAYIVGEKGEVHAFEPNPEMVDILCFNVQLNGLKNIIINPLAAYDRNDEIELEIFEESCFSRLRTVAAAFDRTFLKQIRVRSVALDQYSTERRKPDLIKIDVEGAELFVLHGMRDLLSLCSRKAPTLVFEFSPKNYKRYGYQGSELLSYLGELGYTIYNYQNHQLAPVSSGTDQVTATENNLIAAKYIM